MSRSISVPASLSHVLYLSVAAHHNGAIVSTYGQLVDPCPSASQASTSADPLYCARGRGLDQADDWFHEKANYTPTVAQLDTGPVPMLLMLKRLHHHHHLLTEYSSYSNEACKQNRSKHMFWKTERLNELLLTTARVGLHAKLSKFLPDSSAPCLSHITVHHLHHLHYHRLHLILLA